jgi:hypothetical protein
VAQYLNPATCEAEIWRMRLNANLGKQTPNSKITIVNWAGSVAQVVQHLLYKCEALSSNSSHTKKRKKNEKVKGGKKNIF